MKLAVVSDSTQLAKLEERFRLEELSLWCAETSFQEVLRRRGIPFEILDEFLLEDEWEKINAWGCDRATAWIQFSRERKVFKNVEFSSVMNHRFSYVLIHLVKSYRYACRLVEGSDISSVAIFRSMEAPSYPRFSTHFFVNSFLKELCDTKGIKTEVIEVDGTRPHVFGPERWDLKKWIKRFFAWAYGTVTGPPWQDIQVLAVGSLKRLGSTLEALQARGITIALYDHDFQFQTFRYARRHKIPYLFPESIRREGRVDRESFIERYETEILNALTEACSEGFFKYQNMDFGPFLERYFRERASLRNYLGQLAGQGNQYENLLRKVKISALVSDEDVTDRGSFLAGYFKWKGIPRFCVSHANLTVNFVVPENHQAYDQSLTFVGSEFEKKMYESRGWDGSQIRVTGNPRLDRLIRMVRSNGKSSRGEGGIKLLFCGGSLGPRFALGGYLGLHSAAYSEHQKSSLASLLKVIGGLPIELVVKPHSNEETVWRQFITSRHPSNGACLVPHSADFYGLLTECDALILSYWSTAVMEAALARKPTLLVDLFRSERNSLYPYERAGFCRVVRTEEALKNEIQGLVHSILSNAPVHKLPPGSETEYFLGPQDAKNTHRVVEEILSKTRGRF